MPYSREYNTYRQKVGKQAQDNTELQIEYEKILERVRQTKASVIRMGHRHFTAPVEEIDGTVDSVSPGGLTLKEYPGRKFQFSSVGTSAADMTARIIGKQNKRTRADAAKEVDRRRGELRQYLADNLSGESVRLVIPKGASENAENIRAVVMAGGTNINQVLLSRRTTKRTMVLLDATTGLRRGELLALCWKDIDFEVMVANVTKSVYRNVIGNTKTVASKKPVPIHPVVLEQLKLWRAESNYPNDSDFLFPSTLKNGAQPLQAE